jgi:hypothetical protein
LQAEETDDAMGLWITTTFPTFTIADHDGFTRIGHRDGIPSVLSRIDYILTDVPKPTLLDSRFSAHVEGDLFRLTASDHAAVVAHMHPPRTMPSSRSSVPSWMSSSSSFKDRVQHLLRQRETDPTEITRDEIIEILKVADAQLRNRPPAGPLSDSAKLYWCLVAFRAGRNQHHDGVRRAQRAFPDMRGQDLETMISELTMKVADTQLQQGHQPNKKSESAGLAYMQKIALWRRATPRARFLYIKTDADQIISDDNGMAHHICKHWKQVFQNTNTCDRHYEAMNDIVQGIPAASGVSDEPFDIDEVEASLARHDSAPGPDGLCYSAWRAAEAAGLHVLQRVANGMWAGGPPPDSFRKSFMVFLPKVDSQAVRPEELRPLALCDTDYKVVMGCLNHRLALHLPEYVDDRQRGFIKGRLGLDNVLLLEAAAMLACRSGSKSPILCFLDIAAAFPSILHDYMLQVVFSFVGDHPIYQMIKSMYKDTECELVVRGAVFRGFKVLCGVRQGCPLSGSLFALSFHPVVVSLGSALYKASMHVGHDIFAYADDLALVLYDFWKQLLALDRALAEVAMAAGLLINWKKVQLVPLWPSADLVATKRRLTATCPHWKPAKLAMEAKYLGLLVGPGVSDQSAFANPVEKYLQRCRFIAKLGLGWVRAAAMHNIFALPVLSYVAQVQGDDGLPEVQLDRAAAILFKAPMHRPNFAFFEHLQQLGCGIGLRSVRLECQAAAARCSITLSQLGRARRHLAMGSDDDHLTCHPHRAWQNRSAIVKLATWRTRLGHELQPLPEQPDVQKKCRAHLRELRPSLDYRSLVHARLLTVLRRMGPEYEIHIDTLAANTLEVIILASANLHCTGMQAFLRFCQNGINICAGSGGATSCPMCGAPMAARLSHIVQCGAVWVFLAEQCPGLNWDFSAQNRWMFLFGSMVQDSNSAASLCLAWDSITAGVQAGRFAGNGFEAASARLIALSKRIGPTGRLASLLAQPIPAVQ